MSPLGEFLEVLYSPREPFYSVRAAIRQWRNCGLAKLAYGGNRTRIGRRKVGVRPVDPTIDEERLSVWINGVDQYRIEEYADSADGAPQSTTIVNGADQWCIDGLGQVETSKPHGSANPDIARHFVLASLRQYFVGLSLESLGFVVSAGRNCIRLRAVLRPNGRLWPHWLPCGADDYEFHADPERGVLLYIAGRCKGEIFEINEVTQVAFDETLDQNLFTYTPNADQQARPATPVVEHLTLESAIARMPFTVLVPTRLPDNVSNGFEVMFHPQRANSSRAHLMLMYRGEQALWINQSDRADVKKTADLEWEQIESGGKHLALSDPGVEDGMTVLAFEQQGTHIDIMSNLRREQLIDVATSLAPAKPSSA